MSELRRTCTPAFREGLARLYPGLRDRPAYWRLLGALIFPRQVEDVTGRIVIPQTLLARLEGKERQLASGNYRAYRFLEAFKRDVLPGFAYASEWSYREGRARTVRETGLDPEVERLVERMHRAYALEDPPRVYLDTGARYRASTRSTRRRRLQARLAQEADGAAAPILLYQNGLDVRTFRHRVNANRRAAYEHVERLGGDERRRSMRDLLAVLDEPKPFLKSVARSERVYSVQLSLQNIRSDLRGILVRGWTEYDLRSAQAAITSRSWDVPELRRLLEGGASLWEHLATELGVDAQRAKPAFKIGFYALSYGAGRRRIRRELRAALGDAELAERFLELEVVRSIYRARERRMRRALEVGEVRTLTGRRLPVETHRQARSALSQEVQAAEVHLMRPVYDLALRERERHAKRRYEPFKVALYVFDGVAIQYRDARRAARWRDRILGEVGRRAEALGIPTRLEEEAH